MTDPGDQRQRHGMDDVATDDAQRPAGAGKGRRAATPSAPAPTEEIETSTPSTAPTATVTGPMALRKSSHGAARTGMRLRKMMAQAVSSSAPSETEIRCVISALRFGNCERIRMVMAAAGMLPAARRPTICQSIWPLAAMHHGAAGLGDRRIEQIGTDRRWRVYAEQQDQQRRHQRAAADAGEADDGANRKAGECVEPVHDAPQYRVLVYQR